MENKQLDINARPVSEVETKEGTTTEELGLPKEDCAKNEA